MFDLISGGPRHPFHDRTAAPVVVSIVGHVVILTLVLVLPVLYATDSMPSLPTMMAFVADAPAPPPPPPPAPPKAATAKPVASRPAPTTPSAFAAPIEAPSEVRPEPAGPAVVDYGGEGGVEGGLEGGVAGGIVGGLVAAPPPPAPPPPPQPRAPVRIGGAVQAPALVKRVEPVYPDIALMAKVSGMVTLEAMVDVNGSVESVRILKSLKFLDQAAVEAVKQWKYSPLVLNGIPTPFILSVTLNFRIQEK